MATFEHEGKTYQYTPLRMEDSEYTAGVNLDGYFFSVNRRYMLHPTFLTHFNIWKRGQFKAFVKKHMEYFKVHTTFDGHTFLERLLGMSLERIENGGRISDPNGYVVSFAEHDPSSTSSILLSTSDGEQEALTLGTIEWIGEYRWTCFPSADTPPMQTTQWNKLRNYSYIMNSDDFKFFRTTRKVGPDAMYFGLELEMSTRLSTQEIQKIVTDVEPKQEEFFIFKSDSSIGGQYENNIELVTVPCTPAYQRVEWGKFFDKIERLCKAKGIDIGAVIDMDTTRSNGLHVHLSRSAFFGESQVKRFVTMWNSWDRKTIDLFQRVSGRGTSYMDNTYCKVQGGYLGKKLAHRLHRQSLPLKNSWMQPISEDRYSICHASGNHTVEVRLFQGIPTKEFVSKTINFVESMFEYSKEVPLTEMRKGFVPHYLSWLSKQKRFSKVAKELS